MVRAVGHLDKRKRTFRCQACVRRRIKCDGLVPCGHCVRLKKLCEPQLRDAPQNVKFVTVEAGPGPRSPIAAHRCTSTVPRTYDSRLRDQFFGFFARCHFTRQFGTLAPQFLELVESSGPLRDISLAIGALEASRRASVRSPGKRDPERMALVLYGRAVKGFSSRISSPGFRPEEEALWTTFLLGLFELMSQASSTEAWSMHMIQGMGQVIQYMPSAAKCRPLTTELMKAYRTLEINRAILYGTETLLQVNLEPVSKLGDERGNLAWTTSQNLMLEASAFTYRMFTELESLPCGGWNAGSAVAHCWAHEGSDLFRTLKEALGRMRSSTRDRDVYERLAVANCSATCLYFCRNFGFHPCFAALDVPALAEDETEDMVADILEEAEWLSERQAVPGLLLLFPLRVAGANAKGNPLRARVEGVLDKIYTQGFAVSKWILADLEGLWAWEERTIVHI